MTKKDTIISGVVIAAAVAVAAMYAYKVANPKPVPKSSLGLVMLSSAMKAIASADGRNAPLEMVCESQTNTMATSCKGTGSSGGFTATFKADAPVPAPFKLSGQVRADGAAILTSFDGVPTEVKSDDVSAFTQAFSNVPQVLPN